MEFSLKARTLPYHFLFYLIVTFSLASCGAGKNAVTTRAKAPSTAMQQDVIDYGMKYLKKPYRSAGKGPNAFDCSGYTSFVFKEFGYKLSPSSAGQDKQVPAIQRRQDLQTGDLVFFEGRSRNGRVGHVGIVTETRPNGEFRFIHAATSSGVIISSSTEIYYAQRYLRGGRVLKDDPNYVARKKAPTNNARTAAKENANNKSKNRKQNNAFTPAIAKNEPVPLRVAVVSPPENERLADTTIAVNEQIPVLAEHTEETVIIVQTDSTKNPPLSDTDATKSEEKSKDTIVTLLNTQVTVREDSLTVPDPVVVKSETSLTPQTHIVKPGETLYSISRQYNCSVEQLRHWNPQLGKVLKSGKKLNVSH